MLPNFDLHFKAQCPCNVFGCQELVIEAAEKLKKVCIGIPESDEARSSFRKETFGTKCCIFNLEKVHLEDSTTKSTLKTVASVFPLTSHPKKHLFSRKLQKCEKSPITYYFLPLKITGWKPVRKQFLQI